MPYRRLPNTDNSRLKAMQKALKKSNETPVTELILSIGTLQKIKTFLPNFEKAMVQYKTEYFHQISKNKEYAELSKKAKLYISHFIQVLNFAIARGELNPHARSFYGIGEKVHKIPSLTTESELVHWGEAIIKGEAERILKGGNPLTNPTSALVKVWYEKFLESSRYQKTLQKNTGRSLNNIASLRPEADKIILAAWNEIEGKFDSLPEEESRKKSEEYGISYVFRKNELFENADGVELADKRFNSLNKKSKVQKQTTDLGVQYSLLFPENPKD